MRLLVVSVGRLRTPYADDVDHYRKLISRYVRLEEVQLRDDLPGADVPASVARRLPERAFVSLLTDGGRTYDSPAFSRFLEERRADGRPLAFVIGGTFGLDLSDAEHRLSLGRMTLPHQLARVVLLEQLYRAHKILAGEPYHH